MARGRKRIASCVPLEAEIHAAVIEHWKLLGLPDTLVATLPNANAFGQPGLTKGLADLLVAGPGVPGRVGFIELKRDPQSKVSDDQWRFAKLCRQLDISYARTFGRDEPIALLVRWGLVRRAAA